MSDTMIIRWDRTQGVWHTDIDGVGRYSIRKDGKSYRAYLNGNRLPIEASGGDECKRLVEERVRTSRAIASTESARMMPPPALPWRPIAELDEKARYGDHAGFLLLAPELVDEDCNVHGVGMGYWQDDRDAPVPNGRHAPLQSHDHGGWLACKWSMTNDEWSEVSCNPTHYLRLTGAES